MLPRPEVVENNPQEPNDKQSSTTTIYKKFQPNSAKSFLQSCILTNPVSYQPATILKSDIIFLTPEESAFQKKAEGIKRSSHEVQVVSFPNIACDFIFLPLQLDDLDKNILPGNSRFQYLLTPTLYYDNETGVIYRRMLYIDKLLNNQETILLEDESYQLVIKHFSIDEIHARQKENLSYADIKKIAQITKHIHCKAYLKEHRMGSEMPAIESTNSTWYQMRANRYATSCYVVRDENDQDIGIVSKHLHGFKPMADQCMEKRHLLLTSLNLLTKTRSEAEEERILNILAKIQNEILPYLDRTADPNSSYAQQFFTNWIINPAKKKLGSAANALNIAPQLEKHIRDDKAGIKKLTLGTLLDLRKLLIDRLKQILGKKDDHHHENEIKVLKFCINELELIILDEAVVYIKAMRKIDKQAKDNWVDVEEEVRKHPSATIYDFIKQDDLIKDDVAVFYEDLLNFRIHYGQAIARLCRFFGKDPDGHKRNDSLLGFFIDYDLAFVFLVYDLLDEKPWWKKEDNDFDFYVEDFTEFPDLIHAKSRYDPTKVSKMAYVMDTALKTVGSDLSQNFYNTNDEEIFKEITYSPVFDFQKYVQLTIEILMDDKMHALCADLHMSDQLRLRNSEGKNLPLINEQGNYELRNMSDPDRLPGTIYLLFVEGELWYEIVPHENQEVSPKLGPQPNYISKENLPAFFPKTVKDILEQTEQREKYLQVLLREITRQNPGLKGWERDVRSTWKNHAAERSQSAKVQLAMHLEPFKMLMQKHADFIWECVEENFDTFIKIKKSEFQTQELNENEIDLQCSEMTDKDKELYLQKMRENHNRRCLLNTQANSMLENAMNLSELKTRFYQLREEILAADSRIEMTDLSDNKDILITMSPRPGL